MSQQIPDRFVGGAVDLSHLVSSGAPGRPGAGAAASPGAAGAAATGAGENIEVPSLVIEASEQNFEQLAQISNAVPVVFSLWSPRAEASTGLNSALEKITREQGGRLLLATVNVDENPGLAQAFQVQAVPTAIAILGGRPVPLFQGTLAEEQIREFFAQLVQLAAGQGMNAVLTEAGAPDSEQEAPEPHINPAHVDALGALERGDFAGAITEYEKVLLKAPADSEAQAALVQVRLLHRLEGLSAEEIRSQAAAEPADITAQLRVADLDVSGGHVEDALSRLLDLFAATTDADERSAVREHLLELFEVVGVADPRVSAARSRLASLLF